MIDGRGEGGKGARGLLRYTDAKDCEKIARPRPPAPRPAPRCSRPEILSAKLTSQSRLDGSIHVSCARPSPRGTPQLRTPISLFFWHFFLTPPPFAHSRAPFILFPFRFRFKTLYRPSLCLLPNKYPPTFFYPFPFHTCIYTSLLLSATCPPCMHPPSRINLPPY